MSDWAEWSKHVLNSLERSDKNLQKLDEKITGLLEKLILLEREILLFKTKITLIGTGAAGLLVTVIELIKLLK